MRGAPGSGENLWKEEREGGMGCELRLSGRLEGTGAGQRGS